MIKLLSPLILLMSMYGFAHAHVGQHSGFSLVDGFLHPLSGLDHVMAMLAVGMWSTQGGGRRQFLWPLAFVVAMVVGGAVARLGFPLPLIEPVVAASVVVFGIAVLLALRTPMGAGAVLIATFALAHGYAHGMEAPATGWPHYSAGLAISTALIQTAGIGLAYACMSLGSHLAVRALGVVPVVVGVATLIR